MLHIGTCPKCEQGVRGVRTCGAAPVLMCDECEAVWTNPADSSPVFPAQPDVPSPVTGRSLIGHAAHWCSRDEVAAAGWMDAITGEVEKSERGGAIDPLQVLFENEASLAVWKNSVFHDDRFDVFAPGGDASALEAVILDDDQPRHAEQIRTALRSKKHLVAGLPWGDIGQTREFVSLAEEHRRSLIPLSSWTHHPRTLAMRSAIDDGAIGPVRRVIIGRSESNNAGLEPLLLEAILVAMWASDGVPTSGATTALTADSATLTLEFDTSVALIDVSDDLPKRQWIEIVGTNGSIVCDDMFDPAADAETRFWIHDSDGHSTTHVTPAADGRRETLVSLFRQARTGQSDAGEAVADATEIMFRLLDHDTRGEMA